MSKAWSRTMRNDLSKSITYCFYFDQHNWRSSWSLYQWCPRRALATVTSLQIECHFTGLVIAHDCSYLSLTLGRRDCLYCHLLLRCLIWLWRNQPCTLKSKRDPVLGALNGFSHLRGKRWLQHYLMYGRNHRKKNSAIPSPPQQEVEFGLILFRDDAYSECNLCWPIIRLQLSGHSIVTFDWEHAGFCQYVWLELISLFKI